MSGYDPNQSMLPASGGGNIVAMSGGGVAEQHSNGGGATSNGGGAGLVFASGGDPRIIKFKRTLLGKKRELAAAAKAKRQQFVKSISNTMTKLQEKIKPSVSTNPASSKSAPASAASASTSAPAPTTVPATSAPAPATATSAPATATAPANTTSAPATASTAPTTTAPIPPASNTNIEDILKKLIGSLPKTKDTYTSEEQDTILKNLTPLLYPDTDNKVLIDVK